MVTLVYCLSLTSCYQAMYYSVFCEYCSTLFQNSDTCSCYMFTLISKPISLWLHHLNVTCLHISNPVLIVIHCVLHAYTHQSCYIYGWTTLMFHVYTYQTYTLHIVLHWVLHVYVKANRYAYFYAIRMSHVYIYIYIYKSHYASFNTISVCLFTYLLKRVYIFLHYQSVTYVYMQRVACLHISKVISVFAACKWHISYANVCSFQTGCFGMSCQHFQTFQMTWCHAFKCVASNCNSDWFVCNSVWHSTVMTE